MNPIAIYTSDKYKNQTQTIFIRPNGKTVGLVITLRWRGFTQTWMLDVQDEATGQTYVCNVPLVCSGENLGFDLIGQYDYKRIGAFIVGSLTDELTGINPVYGELSKYELIWGDCLE